ncbi:MAG: hypothetical protein GY851_10460, partial [bacterium]|nr:hypothetical protein [bacterium]
MQFIRRGRASRKSGPQRLVMLELAKYFLGFRITRAGLYLGVGWMLCGSIGSFSVDMPIFRLFFVLAAVFAVAFVAGPLLRPRLTVAGGLPAKASAGHPVKGEFTMTNGSGRAGYDLSVGYFSLPRFLRWRADDAPVVERLGPGDSVRVEVELTPLRRGLYPLPPLRAYSTFPLGLWRCGPKVRRDGSLLVLPDFHPLDEVDVPVGARYQPGGLALTSNVGESPEYIGNREYR